MRLQPEAFRSVAEQEIHPLEGSSHVDRGPCQYPTRHVLTERPLRELIESLELLGQAERSASKVVCHGLLRRRKGHWGEYIVRNPKDVEYWPWAV